MAVWFISISRMPFLGLTLDNANPLFALVITPGFYLHHVEVADQDSASGSLQADYQYSELLFPKLWIAKNLDKPRYIFYHWFA